MDQPDSLNPPWTEDDVREVERIEEALSKILVDGPGTIQVKATALVSMVVMVIMTAPQELREMAHRSFLLNISENVKIFLAAEAQFEAGMDGFDSPATRH